ncbi:MAG TPA: ATP-binding protein [Bryobacteraceae bacterium]|jgi:heavy metal sensor kinase
MPFPVRTRLTIWYSVILSIGLLLFSTTVWLVLRQILRSDLSTTLANQTRGFEEYLHLEDEDPSLDLVKEIDEYSQSLPQDHLLLVYDALGGPLYTHPPGKIQTDLRGRAFAVAGTQQEFQWNGHPYLGISRSIRLRRGSIHVFLALSSEYVSRAVNILGFALAIVVPVFLLGTLGGGYWLSRRALRPVDKITEAARTIGISDLSERLPALHTNDELQRLIETWNGMLDRLEASIDRISRFTSDASHELRTPVAIIRLAAESALRRTRTESEYQAALRRILKQSESMTSLIDDLLFLARTDVEQIPAGDEWIDLGKLIEGLCADLAPLATEKNIALNYDLPSGPATMRGRLSDLRRLLLILLDNGIKYTPEGGCVTVQLSLNSEFAVVTVEDTGPGIPEEARVHLFQRFFRADPSRNRESGGHGLGLAIAHAIVQQHKASLTVQPSAAGGSKFSVALPRAWDEAS